MGSVRGYVIGGGISVADRSRPTSANVYMLASGTGGHLTLVT